MASLYITKIFDFEMAHALEAYDGACANIHGHSYKLEVSIGGEPLKESGHPKNGMIMDFGELKQCVNETILRHFDHFLVLSSNTPKDLSECLKKHYGNVVFVPYQPTSENLLLDFAEKLKKQLPERVFLSGLRLYETKTSYTDWRP